MREIKFRLVKNNLVQGIVELKPGYFIDPPYEWDTAYEFTGLSDKNEKEIYEGDIVKVRGGDYKDKNARIEWCGTCCLGFRLQFIGIGNNESLRIPEFKDIEIIGNIYENPDLLDKERE